MTDAAALLDGAAEWLEAARAEQRAGRVRVAFEAARHAAELAGKAIPMDETKEHPKSHLIAGALARHALLPPGLDGRRLHRLLSEFTLGTYGFDRPLTEREVEEALDVAQAMVASARSRLGVA